VGQRVARNVVLVLVLRQIPIGLEEAALFDQIEVKPVEALGQI
jgi:hypothetical protein